MEYLADIHVVDSDSGLLIPLTLFLRQEAGIELLAVELPALDGKVGLGIDGVAELGELHGESCSGHLVDLFPDSKYLMDGVHPQTTGARMLAEAIYSKVKW